MGAPQDGNDYPLCVKAAINKAQHTMTKYLEVNGHSSVSTLHTSKLTLHEVLIS